MQYQSIIRRLNESQKIRLLTHFNSLSEPEMTDLGLPRVTRASLNIGNDGTFPSTAALSRSFDPELVAAVAAREAAVVAEKGHRCVVLPGAKAAVGSVRSSLSEDPRLSGAMAGALLSGASSVGIKTFMDGYGYRNRGGGPAWSHRTPTAAVVYDHLTAPFSAALSSGSCAGVIVDPSLLMPPEWIDGSEDAPARLTVRQSVGDADTVRAVERGDLCFEGSPEALQSALHTHRRMQSAINHGRATTGELDAAIASGEAIAEGTLDAALERLIAFAETCTKAELASVPVPDDDPLPGRALRAATVLLENRDRTLPLHPLERLCIIGEPTDEQAISEAALLLEENGYECVAHAPGYRFAEDRSDSLIDEAESAAMGADTVILFLSAERHGGTRTVLPANQLALYDRLGRMKKQMVVVISADTALDLSFLGRSFSPPAAVMLAPLHVRNGIRHTVEVLIGKYEPEGRLTVSFPDTDAAAYNRHGLREGPLLGYRYYDIAGGGVRYPFGHGLSYTKMVYSRLSVTPHEVSFQLTNKGKRHGVAVPQIYLGLASSAILRPAKELVGFTRIELAPGESTTVRIPLKPITTYDPKSGRAVVETGTYTVSVGNSVSDIRLCGTVPLGDTVLDSDRQSLISYLPSLSNIQKDHYTLEAEYTPMKSSLRNPLFGAAALLLAVCVKIFDVVSNTNTIFLDILAAILAVGAIVFLAMEMIDRKRQVVREQERLEEINSILYADADKIDAPTAHSLFDTAYDPNCAEEEIVIEEVAPATTSGEYDYYADVDKTMTFTDAARDFARLAVEKGVELDEASACSILSSMATSRLVVVRGMNNKQFSSLMTVLSEYLACPLSIDRVDESYKNESSVLFRPDASEASGGERSTLETLLAAQNRIRNIHIAALTDVTWNGLSGYFVPYANYVRAPLSAANVTVQDPSGRHVSYRIPENLWFFLNLREKETLVNIPDYVAEVATVNTWHVGSTKPVSGSCTEFRQFYYGQMLYLSDSVKTAFVLDEDTWKKIDRLESFAGRHTEFHIGNKQWLGLETYLAVLSSTGVEVLTALDEAMAVKLLPAFIHALSGKLARDERGLGETLDVIFGDNHTARCRKTIKESGADLI